MRPVGAMVLGPIGDRFGRRAMLVISVLLMGLSSLVMGLLPTFAQIGLAAPVLMVLCRMGQGMSVGGEYTGSMTYSAEIAPKRWRGTLSSLATVGCLTGFLLGSATDWILKEQLGAAAVSAWAWRVPFLLGLPICAVAIWLRSSLPETQDQGAKDDLSVGKVFKDITSNYRKAFEIISIVTGVNIAFYLFFVWAPDLLEQGVAKGAPWVQGLNTMSMAYQIPLIVAGGWLSDRFGRRLISMISVVMLMIVSVPAMHLCQSGSETEFAIGQAVVAIPISILFGLQGAMIVELTPAAIRCSLFSVAYSAAIALFAGTSPLMATWLTQSLKLQWGPVIYLLAGLLVSLWTLFTLPETHHQSLAEVNSAR
jgi:MHS family proline/betaine transporter-like MFS transporter